jgi:predicted dehydrogenase
VAHEEALARRDVDAALIATPDHLHLDLAVDALKAGKHVYLEKPALHHFAEGAELLRAAHRYGKVLTVGTQQRSGAHYRRAKEEIFAKNGLGKVLIVRAVWSDFPWQARRIADQPKPPNLDWLRFVGRSPYREYTTARYDSWRYFPEYGGGVLADILNHWADVAQWMMEDTTPVDAVATGGVYLAADGRANPDTVNAILRYRKGWNLTFESTVHPLDNPRPTVEFLGTEGTLDLARASYIFKPKKGSPVEVKAEGSLEAAHATDFLDAVARGGKPSADLATGLAGLLPCHLARAAYWSGRRARWDASRQEIVTD